jgi:branched-chain amino acid transport system permease protein
LRLLLIFVCFFKYTRWGLSMQATADDETAALSLGVSARFVYAAAWAIAFMSAGVGGALLGNINGINISIGYLGLLVLPAVVLGGLNSVPGAIVGGIIIGLLQNLSGTYLDQFFRAGSKRSCPLHSWPSSSSSSLTDCGDGSGSNGYKIAARFYKTRLRRS